VSAHRLATGFSTPEESTGLLLWQVTNRWQAAQRAALKPFDLTHVQFVLLAALTWLGAEGPVTQRALADYAGTDPMMTSQVVRVLERRELLARTAHHADRRAWSLAVTDRGASLANRAVVAVEACDETFFRPLGREQPAFTRALSLLGHDRPSTDRTARAPGFAE
jgi:DNA-binding MarR family transcriptional regulator